LSLFFVVSALSKIVGNNPAVMLLVPYLDAGGGRDTLGAALTLGTGFASNLIAFGSLARITVVEQAARRGVKISFGELASAGVPVALARMAVAAVWIVVLAE
jgi:Na+/H+ antiporter NhaD/arsenite permease-like protein